MDIDAEKVMECAKITHGKLLVEGVDDLVKQCGGVGCENDIIHVEKKVGSGGGCMENEKRGVTFGGSETECVQVGGEFEEPCPWSLFEPIEGLVEFAHMGRVVGVNETRRLGTVDCFGELTMQECIFDIQLMDGPLVGCGDAEDHTDRGRFHHRGECFIIVHTFLLSETTKNPTCFVPCKGAVRMELVTEYPFACNHVDTCRTRH
jgi:hypothetical protein